MSTHDQAAATDHVEPSPAANSYITSQLFILLAGVVLPAFTLSFEAATHFSGQAFFDPIPDLLHALLIALVPLTNAGLLLTLRHSQPRYLRPLALLHSFAMGIAVFYAVLYLPLMPFAPVAVLFYGVGLLPLAPLLAFFAAKRARTLLQRHLDALGRPALPRVWRGLGLALLALVLIELPQSLTHIGLQMSTSSEPAMQRAGLRWLRAVGNDDFLRQLGNSRSGMSTDLIGMLVNLGRPVGPDTVRKIHYQVTGLPFNEQPAAPRRGLREGLANWQWDADRGGNAVGAQLRGVSLASSRLDGTLDAEAALGYLEWTLVLRNDSIQQQEGRAQIALPPGGVVSRLTLWIDGEEREAAFGGRAQTRQAYQKVVQRQRDPVLVSSAGKDRVMLQLFPIPPSGGEMKVRLGITVPLPLAGPSLAHLQLPAFRERNFVIAPGFAHVVWMAADTPLSAPGLAPLRTRADGPHTLRGEVAEGALGGNASLIEVPRNSQQRTAWTDDALAGQGRVVVQRLAEQPTLKPRRVALVVDGSRALAPLGKDIAAALAQFPASVELGYFPASDMTPPAPGAMPPAQAAAALQGLDFAGGQDNLEALGQAWDWAAAGAAAGSPGIILWIHGPQPILLGSIEPLLQRSERQLDQVRLLPLEAVPGPNKVLEALDTFPFVFPVERSNALSADLGRLIAGWGPGGMTIEARRQQLATAQVPREHASKTSDHLARLWATDQIRQLLAQGDPAARQAATDLAVAYHLVTPVSGAVVLETAQQYDEAGLTPVAQGSVPTVPEPEEWMLMAAVAILLLWLARRQPAARPWLAA